MAAENFGFSRPEFLVRSMSTTMQKIRLVPKCVTHADLSCRTIKKMRSLKINRLLPIYISILPLKFGVDIQSQTKVSPETKKFNMAARRPFWKWRRWKSIGSYPYIQVLCHLSLELIFKAKLKLESGNQKIQNGCLAAILKLTLLKINRLLHIYISIVLLKFGVDIQSQTEVRVWKPKNPIWPPGGHFESDVTENQ